MALDVSKVHSIIWDLDNTLYRFTPEFKYECNVAAAKAGLSLGLNMGYEEALKIAVHSEDKYGSSLRTYIDEYGLSSHDLHEPFHDNISTNSIVKIQNLTTNIKTLKLNHIILTNASRKWAKKALAFIGLEGFFLDTHIVALEDVDHQIKSMSNLGFKKATEILNTAPENCVMIDDLERNLFHASAMDMQTVFVHYNDKLDPLMPYVTAQYQDANEFIEILKA